MLKETFFNLVSKYTDNQYVKNDLWFDIEKRYSTRQRHYHTLDHLKSVLVELLPLKKEIDNWDVVLFSLYYHDIIYNFFSSKNELKSAVHATKQMQELSMSDENIELCNQHIIATKAHCQTSNSDTNYFTDADLSILGASWNTYEEYLKNVRKEYALFPKFMYVKGRKKALTHILGMTRIFKTDYFHSKYEKQARINLRKELEQLS